MTQSCRTHSPRVLWIARFATCRNDCFDNRGKGAECGLDSSLRQPRLAQPVETMLDVLGVLEDGNMFVALNLEPRVDPQHLRGFFPGLLKLAPLRIGKRQHD